MSAGSLRMRDCVRRCSRGDIIISVIAEIPVAQESAIDCVKFGREQEGFQLCRSPPATTLNSTETASKPCHVYLHDDCSIDYFRQGTNIHIKRHYYSCPKTSLSQPIQRYKPIDHPSIGPTYLGLPE